MPHSNVDEIPHGNGTRQKEGVHTPFLQDLAFGVAKDSGGTVTELTTHQKENIGCRTYLIIPINVL